MQNQSKSSNPVLISKILPFFAKNRLWQYCPAGTSLLGRASTHLINSENQFFLELKAHGVYNSP
jgi:hypothetical protein